jgi:hypothetical protein
MTDEERALVQKMLKDDKLTIDSVSRASATYLLLDILLATALIIVLLLWYLS